MARFDKCVFILFDGSRWDVMNDLAAAGRLPNIGRYFHGKIMKAVSAFPTVSGPAHLPFMTGRFPGRLDIPGIYWFDRQEYAKPYFTFKKFRSYLGFFKINKMNRDVAPGAKNIFEF
ncbi:MAG: alkaline phosphatase family protein, partial [Deltaproteobacteria bacterium]|nr:alkaline phosphatase family protein [Deltaproteobacteria bacterium]